MAKAKVPDRPVAGPKIRSRGYCHRWSTRELGKILWLTCALRDRRDEQARRFWDAVDCFETTAGHPIERRRLRRKAQIAFRREYGGVAGRKAVA